MPTLEPVTQSILAELSEVIDQIAEEGMMDLNPVKEKSYLRIVSDPRKIPIDPTQYYWAVTDPKRKVVGYMSAKIPQPNDRTAPNRPLVGFIKVIAILSGEQGKGFAGMAILEFASLCKSAGMEAVELELDGTGDPSARRAAFEKIGFNFEHNRGYANAEDLLKRIEI
ncbi:hypothetical protein AYJ66_14105 [Dietzia cinnamea]|nr:hypothetical protein AYJ66_14105 [Dietzia cinnamea]